MFFFVFEYSDPNTWEVARLRKSWNQSPIGWCFFTLFSSLATSRVFGSCRVSKHEKPLGISLSFDKITKGTVFLRFTYFLQVI